MGHALLQKLGWRPGQGIGPRVTLRKLRIQDGKLGRAPLGTTYEEDSEEASKHTYAPRDTQLLVYTAKDDKTGLGFQKGMGMGRLPGRRGVYGAGPVEDDNEDPYTSTSATDRTLYAFDDGEEADVVMIGDRSTEKPGVHDENHWHDGHPVLQGFVLDPKGVPKDKWCDALSSSPLTFRWGFPDIAAGWNPNPSRVWAVTMKDDVEPSIRGAPNRSLTHAQRGQALGENTRAANAASVWDYMSEKDRERLAAVAAQARRATVPPPALSMEAEPEVTPERATGVYIPPLSPRTASSALQGFMPFADDLEKQERYRSYLISQQHNTKQPSPRLLPSSNTEEVNKELASFAASARIFKPMSYAMSSRFTSGSSALAASDMKQARPGLHLFDASKGPQFAKASEAEFEVKKELSPREQAAHDGRYGAQTRVVKEFFPEKLVCKRFHVSDPHPEGKPDSSGPSTPKAGYGLDSILPKNDAAWEPHFVHQAGTDQENTPPSLVEEVGERKPGSIAEVGMADDINQGRDTLTYTKPDINIFKAIFASDDEGDDEDEDDVPQPRVTAEEDERPHDPFPVVDTPLDYSTFKPVFKRGGGGNRTGGHKIEEQTEKKKKKDRKKRKGVLSFDVEEDEGAVPGPKPKKKAKPAQEDEWVEKQPPRFSSELALPEANPDDRAADPSKLGRKGAADFFS